MRIVRVANFVTERSGGLRVALHELGAGYAAAGHEPVLIVPGADHHVAETGQGRVITLPGPVVPRMGGYRVLTDRARVARVLREVRPDRVEVSDRTTLRWVGRWARRAGVPSMMVSHESLDGLVRVLGPGLGPARWSSPGLGPARWSSPGLGPAQWSRPGLGAARRLADGLNARTAAGHDLVVCTTAWAAAEFERIGAANLARVPLGVDLERFHPGRHDPALRRRWAAPQDLLLLHCGRLSVEKRPRRSLEALAGLRAAGVPAVLAVAGGGPLRAALQAEAAARGLPVRFLGHLTDRTELAGLLATADVVLAPGPVETFGLAALEALASGTPVVVSAESALPEVVGAAGLSATGEGPAYATAVRTLAARPVAERRAAARRQAERFPWSAAVAGFLRAHETAADRAGRTRRPGPARATAGPF